MLCTKLGDGTVRIAGDFLKSVEGRNVSRLLRQIAAIVLSQHDDITGAIFAEHANELHGPQGRHMELPRHRLANIAFGKKAFKERHRLMTCVAASRKRQR